MCEDLELTDRTLSEIASQLTHIGDRWEKLGFYLNVDQNTVARIRYEQRSTMSKIYQLLRRWRERTRNASWAQLEQAIKWIGASLQPPPGAVGNSAPENTRPPPTNVASEFHQIWIPWLVHTFRLLLISQIWIYNICYVKRCSKGI